MLDLKIKKNQVGVYLALLALILIAAACYVYRGSVMSEGYADADDNDYDSDDDEVEGFDSLGSFALV